MKDIKGNQVNIGDKVLLGTSYGLLVRTFIKESLKSFILSEGCRLNKYENVKWVGYGKGTNSSGYQQKDVSQEPYKTILKVDDNFEL